jgi:hypothetical protein
LGSYANNPTYRNFRIGWDGSVHGGLYYNWSIDSAGKANFDYLTANSGGSIAGWNIGKNILSADGITLRATATNDEGETIVINAGNGTFSV